MGAFRRLLFWQREALHRLSPAASGSVHLKAGISTAAITNAFILASLPAFLVDVWQEGRQYLAAAGGSASGSWRETLLASLDLPYSADSWLANFVVGLSLVAPMLMLAAAVSFCWALLFAGRRDGPVDAGWLLLAWFFVLLVPADLSFLLVALGVSFAALLGQHVFGGTGRYLVSPAALGVLFVQFSYPDSAAQTGPLSWADFLSAWSAGSQPAAQALGGSPYALLMPIACAVGAMLLLGIGAISWRLIASAAIGVVVAGLFLNEAGDLSAPFYGHLLAGNAPICIAFILSDPSAAALSREARWVHGALFGLLVVAIRTLDPTHPDGALYAVLLSTLFVPVVDAAVVRTRLWRTRGRLRLA